MLSRKLLTRIPVGDWRFLDESIRVIGHRMHRVCSRC